MNRPFKWLTFVCLICLLHSQLFSQKNYLPGYIIKLNGDSLNGYVTFRNPDKNPDRIYFRTTENGEPSTYTPLELMGFGQGNTNYESAIIKSIENPDDINLATPQFTFITDTTFLQVVVKGEKSLYYFKDKNNFRNFYIRNGDKYEVLLYKQYLKTLDDSRTMLTDKKNYIDQLKLYLGNCDKIRSQIDKTPYEYNKLLDLFNAYYRCTDQTAAYRDIKVKLRAEFGFLAGVTVTKFKSKGNFLSDADFKSSVDPTAAIFLNLVMPRHFKNFSIENELLFNTYTVTTSLSTKSPTYNQYTYHRHYTIGASYIKLNNLLRYTTGEPSLRFFINAGVSNGYAISSKNNGEVVEDHYGDFFIKYSEPAFYSFKKYELGVIGGAGIKINKMSGELRVESGNGVANYLNIKTTTTRFSLLLGYTFR